MVDQGELGPAHGPSLSRRVLMTGAIGAAFALLAERSEAQGGGAVDPASNWLSPEKRLVRRITMGLSDDHVLQATKLGYNGYLEWQLAYSKIDDSASEKQITKRYPRLSKGVTYLYNLEDDWITSEQLVNATLYRSIYSRRQLYQRMVEFWSDHFNTWRGKVPGALQSVHDRDVIRKHALGKFPDLARAVSNSPAMLLYLDNDPSDKAAPNQNYARELMELHTLGVNGGYTQDDVLEVAKCFTGWSFYWEDNSPNRGKYVFRQDYHDVGPKTVLGISIPAGGGKSDADTVLNILVSHPSTATFIARKMARWLLRYDPPTSIVNSVANVYMNTGGDIKSMIREILKQSNLMAAPAKYKRPLHMFVSLIRALKPKFQNFDHLRWGYLETVAQVPFDWPPPNGYPDAIDYWAGFILPRWRFSFDLAAGWVGGMQVDLKLVMGTASTANQVADRIDSVMFGGEMLPQDKSDLLAFLNAGQLTSWRKRAAIGLAAASPSFQWY